MSCLVRVAATTLNFNDVDGVRGRYRTGRATTCPIPPAWRCWASVEGAGSGAEAWLGKRVVAMPRGAFGGYAELAVGPAAMAFEMPPVVRAARHAGGRRLSPVPPVVARPARPGEDPGGRDRARACRRRRGRLGRRPARQRWPAPGSSRQQGRPRSSSCAGRLVPTFAINYRGPRLRRGGARGDRRPRGRRGVRLGRGRGHDQDVPVHGLQRPSPLGRIRVRASRPKTKGSCPDRCCSGTSPSPGCVSPTSRIPAALKRASGYNFPSHADGQRVHARILDLISTGTVRPVVGREVAFDDLPRRAASNGGPSDGRAHGRPARTLIRRTAGRPGRPLTGALERLGHRAYAPLPPRLR